MADLRATWCIPPRGRGRPKADESDDAPAPVAEDVAAALSPCQVASLRAALLALPCVESLTELQQDLLVSGVAQALPLYIAARGANRRDLARRGRRGMKPRFHRAHLLNDVSTIWEHVTRQAGTAWVKRNAGKPLRASPVVQIAKVAAQVMGDDVSLGAWRSQIELADEILGKERLPTLEPQSVISLKG